MCDIGICSFLCLALHFIIFSFPLALTREKMRVPFGMVVGCSITSILLNYTSNIALMWDLSSFLMVSVFATLHVYFMIKVHVTSPISLPPISPKEHQSLPLPQTIISNPQDMRLCSSCLRNKDLVSTHCSTCDR